MNEQLSFERHIADRIAQEGSAASPAGAVDEIISKAGERRPMPRWLALIKEPPMRISHNVAVGSPTVRVAAVMAATLLLALVLAGAGIAGSRLLAADGTIVVAQDGSGTYTTIAAAVAAAEDGDEILVMPGTYAEAVVIDKDITLHGADRDSVIIESGEGCVEDESGEEWVCPEGTPLYDKYWFGDSSFGMLLEESDAQISDLTFRSPTGNSLAVNGGAPLIERITYAKTGDSGSLYIHGGSSAIVKGSDMAHYWVFFEEQSPATIEDSTFHAVVANTDNTAIRGGPATIRNNVATGIAFNGSALVEGNTLIARPDEDGGFYGSGIDVQAGDGWVIKDNHLAGFPDTGAIAILGTGEGTISGNTLTDNEFAIAAGSGVSVIEGNTVTGGDVGIVTSGPATLVDNQVTGVTGRGIVLSGDATLRGNRSCDNGENLRVSDTASPDIDDSNEICEDAAAG